MVTRVVGLHGIVKRVSLAPGNRPYPTGWGNRDTRAVGCPNLHMVSPKNKSANPTGQSFTIPVYEANLESRFSVI